MFLYVYGWVVLVATVLFAAIILRGNFRVRSVAFACLTLPAVLYPLGKSMQFAHFGPTFGTSYFSDIGFISFASSAPLFFGFGRGRRSPIEASLRWATGALVLAVLVEMIQFGSNPHFEKGEFGPRGDTIDLAIFGGTYLVATYLLAVLAGSEGGWKWLFERAKKIARPAVPPSHWSTRRPNTIAQSTRPPRERRSTRNRARRKHGRR